MFAASTACWKANICMWNRIIDNMRVRPEKRGVSVAVN